MSASNPLVQRLRDFEWPRVNDDIEHWQSEPLCLEAADEIERLVRENEALSAAMKAANDEAVRLTRERDEAYDKCWKRCQERDRALNDLAETQQLCESLQNKWASRPLDHPSGEALIAENDRLRHYADTCGGSDNDGRCPMKHLMRPDETPACPHEWVYASYGGQMQHSVCTKCKATGPISNLPAVETSEKLRPPATARTPAGKDLAEGIAVETLTFQASGGDPPIEL